MKHKLTIILFLINFSWSFAQETIDLSDTKIAYTIGQSVYFFSDSTGRLSIDDILSEDYQQKFVKSEADVPNLKNTKSAIWMKFTVNFIVADEWMFEYAAPYVDTVNFYKILDNKDIKLSKTGTCVPFKNREVQSPNFIFKLIPEAKTYYLQIRTDLNPQFPIKIMTKNRLIAKNHTTDLVHGFYFGLILLIVLYNFFIWTSSREPIYIYYVFYAFVIGFLIFMNKGYAFKYLWPDFHAINKYIYSVASLLSISNILFAINFLEMKKYVPRITKILIGLIFAFIGIIALDISGYFSLSGMLSKNLSSLLTVIILPTVVYIYKKGHKPALFFLVAWSLYVVGALIHLLRLKAILPYNDFTANSLQIGSAFEMILLSFAIADLLNQLRKENDLIVKEQNIRLEKEVKKQTAELREKQGKMLIQNQELIVQKEIIEGHHKHITDSINYAKRIQDAILPTFELFENHFSDYFILFKPRDVVSGDFYWAKKIDDYLIFVVSDCTGHGVPGAFVSMLGISFLNEIAQNDSIWKSECKASQLLEMLRDKVKTAFHQKGDISDRKDGMDLVLCILNTKTKKLQFAGAHNSLYIIRQKSLARIDIENKKTTDANPVKIWNKGDYVVSQIKGDPMPIAVYPRERPFTNYKTQLLEGDVLFMFSDGFPDQLGGKNGQKFMIKDFRNLLLDINHKPMPEQKQILNNTLKKWMRNKYEQVDDILVLGVRI